MTQIYAYIYFYHDVSTIMMSDDVCAFKNIMHTGRPISIVSWKTYVYVLHSPLQMTRQNVFFEHPALIYNTNNYIEYLTDNIFEYSLV